MSIPISKKHGVNPSLELCLYCGEPKGVALFGKMGASQRHQMFPDYDTHVPSDYADPSDVEAPRQVVLDREPCDKCKERFSVGIALFHAEGDESNPIPTGTVVVITEEAARRIFRPAEVLDQVLEQRAAFLPQKVWDMLGLDEYIKRSEQIDDAGQDEE